jgi:HlyD family secretion protein
MNKIVPTSIGKLQRVARTWLTVHYEQGAPPAALPFLNPIDAVCEEPPPRFMRSSHYMVMALFFLLLLLASLAKVDTVVVGNGTLVTLNPPSILQAMDRGIIRELRVRPGDTVHKGQVLAVLDPTFAHADYNSVSAQQRSAAAQVRRLEAELSGKPMEAPAASDAAGLLQFSIYQQRQEQYKSRLRVFDEDIQGLSTNIKSTAQDEDSLKQQLGFARELESMRAQLMASQNGSKLNFLDAQSMRVRTEREYNDTISHLTGLQHGLQSKQAERQGFIDDWRQQILENLSTARAEATRSGDSLSKATLLNDLVEVTAQEDGVVLDVAKRSVGSIVRDAEPIVTIVPDNTPLVADITISSSDVGHIQAGDEVLVKVDALPYLEHGLLKGVLSYVSEESYAMAEAGGEPQGHHAGGAVHRGRVIFTNTKLEHMPEGARLIPGMTVDAEIKVGERRLISFFTYPLTRGLNESLREP